MEIAIIGAGAAGVFAAITVAERLANATITIFDAGPRPLAKVAISGGGRCNVTHNLFDISKFVGGYPRGSKELVGPFHRFQAQDTVRWFAARGVTLVAEEDGRMFPSSNTSKTIIDCLLREAARVRFRQRCRVSQIRRIENRFELVVQDADSGTRTVFADRVLLSTGGIASSYQLASSLGHTIVSPVPSLFTFEIEDPRINQLAGLSVPNARVLLPFSGVKEQEGPVLITHWGLSGPAILRLSAWGARPLAACNYSTDLRLNWLGMTTEGALETLRGYKQQVPRKSLEHSPFPTLPKRLWKRFVECAAIADATTWATVSGVQLRTLAEALTQGQYPVRGKGQYKDEFVTCGGVELSEVDFRTMQSRCCQGLFLAGEVLNIDGITGGFNFQSAWTTGYIAGLAMATDG